MNKKKRRLMRRNLESLSKIFWIVAAYLFASAIYDSMAHADKDTETVWMLGIIFLGFCVAFYIGSVDWEGEDDDQD